MDFLGEIIVGPFHKPQGWIAYLLLPVLVSAIASSVARSWWTWVVVALSAVVSVTLYFAVFIVLYGVSSTLPLGMALAFIIHAAVSALVVRVLRQEDTADAATRHRS
jgi:biotin transporter BioY